MKKIFFFTFIDIVIGNRIENVDRKKNEIPNATSVYFRKIHSVETCLMKHLKVFSDLHNPNCTMDFPKTPVFTKKMWCFDLTPFSKIFFLLFYMKSLPFIPFSDSAQTEYTHLFCANMVCSLFNWFIESTG